MNKQQYRLEIRFGDEILEAGFTAVPNLFLKRYRYLGISDAAAMWVIHLLRFKWSEEAPYPTQAGLPMACNEKTRRRYARQLRNLGLLFTRRRHYTKETAPGPDLVGKLEALEYHFDSLFHNIVRVDGWLAAKKPLAEFAIEIPFEIVRKVVHGYFQDVPKTIKRECEQHLARSALGSSLLLPRTSQLPDFQVVEIQVVEKRLVENRPGIEEDSYLQEDSYLEKEAGAEERAAASAANPLTYELLAGFGIEEPALSELARDDLEPRLVRAWLLYLDTQDMERKPGYLVNRLRARQQPPADFLALAELTDDQIATLERLARQRRWLGSWPGELTEAGIDRRLAETWYQVLGKGGLSYAAR